jgi:hypothetical protein
MINKDNFLREENNGITPEAVNEALDSLPSNYVKQAQIVLEQWKESGIITKTYSKVYISRVKTADKGAFNEDIMNALVEVGTKKIKKSKYGRIKKKALHLIKDIKVLKHLAMTNIQIPLVLLTKTLSCFTTGKMMALHNVLLKPFDLPKIHGNS